jgi:uncharacterized protein (DUF39 family)
MASVLCVGLPAIPIFSPVLGGLCPFAKYTKMLSLETGKASVSKFGEIKPKQNPSIFQIIEKGSVIFFMN